MANHGGSNADFWEQLGHRAYASLNSAAPVDMNQHLRAELAQYGEAPRWVLDGLLMAHPHTSKNNERGKAWQNIAKDLVREYASVAAIPGQILRCGVDESASHAGMFTPRWHERGASLVIEAACRVGIEHWLSDEKGKSFETRRTQLKELEALNARVNDRLHALVGLADDIRRRAELARTVGAVVWKQDADLYDVLGRLRDDFPAWGVLTRRELDRFVSVATVTSQPGPELADLIEAIGSIARPAEVAIPTTMAPYLSQSPLATKKQKTAHGEYSTTKLGRAPFVLSFAEKLHHLVHQTGIQSIAKNGLWIENALIAKVMNLVCDFSDSADGSILDASAVGVILSRRSQNR